MKFKEETLKDIPNYDLNYINPFENRKKYNVKQNPFELIDPFNIPNQASRTHTKKGFLKAGKVSKYNKNKQLPALTVFDWKVKLENDRIREQEQNNLERLRFEEERIKASIKTCTSFTDSDSFPDFEFTPSGLKRRNCLGGQAIDTLVKERVTAALEFLKSQKNSVVMESKTTTKSNTMKKSNLASEKQSQFSFGADKNKMRRYSFDQESQSKGRLEIRLGGQNKNIIGTDSKIPTESVSIKNVELVLDEKKDQFANVKSIMKSKKKILENSQNLHFFTKDIKLGL